MINERTDSLKHIKNSRKVFSLNGFDLKDENFFALRCRSNSCRVPSIEDLAYCLDFVPKLRYLSCPEKDDIDSDSTYEENNLFKIESNKTYEKNSLKSKEGVLTYEYLGERFCAEQEIDDNLITKAKSDSLNENKNKEAPLAITRKKSRVLPEEIKLNPRYLKGYAMDFESIYDLYERDLESLDRLDNRTAKANDSYVNFVNIGSQENKPFMTRKSLNPFSPTKKNFNMSETLKNPIISESVDNDYDDLKNNNNFDFKKDENDFKIKERTKSILKMLEFTLVRKRSLEQE